MWYDDYYHKFFLKSGMGAIKSERRRWQRLRKNFSPLPGIHQGSGIGVFLKMKKKIDRKIMGINIDFFVSDDRIQKV